jgi:hypothetical protein
MRNISMSDKIIWAFIVLFVIWCLLTAPPLGSYGETCGLRC